MRIIIIADYAIAEGGAPQVAIASALGLAQLGHEVIYIHGVGATGDAKLEAEPRIQRISLGGSDVWRKPVLVAARDGVWNRAYQPRLAALLAELRTPETVVHVHQWTKFFSPSVFGVIAESGLPMTISLHDYFLSCPTGLKYRFDQNRPCELRPLTLPCLAATCDPRSSLHKLIRVLRAFAVRKALGGRAYTAIHVSEIGRRTIGAYLPPQARQVVLENPIECENLGLRSPDNTDKIAYCGRLTVEKGADLVAEAARQLGMKSLFIGDGPLRARILDIDPRAEITGWLPKAEAKARIAAEALALVAPSRWPETGPLVVGEAMASGVPVIVSDSAGASGRIDNPANGYVIRPETDQIVRAIKDLSSRGKAAAVGEAGYHSFWTNPPSLRAHAVKLIEIYNSAFAD